MNKLLGNYYRMINTSLDTVIYYIYIVYYNKFWFIYECKIYCKKELKSI